MSTGDLLALAMARLVGPIRTPISLTHLLGNDLHQSRRTRFNKVTFLFQQKNCRTNSWPLNILDVMTNLRMYLPRHLRTGCITRLTEALCWAHHAVIDQPQVMSHLAVSCSSLFLKSPPMPPFSLHRRLFWPLVSASASFFPASPSW